MFNQASLASEFSQGVLVDVSADGTAQSAAAQILAHGERACTSFFGDCVALRWAHADELAQHFARL